MELTIKVRETDGLVVLAMSGRLMLGKPVQDLRKTIRRLLDGGHRSFVFNLSGVSYMDSTGLSQVIAAYASAKNRCGQFALVSPSTQTGELLKITKLTTVLDVYDAEAEAIAALGNRRHRDIPISRYPDKLDSAIDDTSITHPR